MRLDDSLSWLALTPGLASRLSARRLKRFDSPENIFRASLTQLESCNLPAAVAQAVVKRKRSSARKKNWRRCAPFRTAR
jgi:predicted Rossmann fold nucleotide-binding protein DprA/Smf involved in DNA uptake